MVTPSGLLLEMKPCAARLVLANWPSLHAHAKHQRKATAAFHKKIVAGMVAAPVWLMHLSETAHQQSSAA